MSNDQLFPPRAVLHIDDGELCNVGATETVEVDYGGTKLTETNLIDGHVDLPGVLRGVTVARMGDGVRHAVVAICPGDGRRENVAVIVKNDGGTRISMPLPYFIEHGYRVVSDLPSSS